MSALTIQRLQVRDNAFIVYDEYINTKNRKFNILSNYHLSKARQVTYSGLISKGTKKRITKAVTLLVQASEPRYILNPVTKRYIKHRLAFITLTVSDSKQKLSGKEAYEKLLSHFLQWLRRTEKVNTYIWKAEHQKNGQIHYHITTPSFIHWQRIRDKWNNLQLRNGLLDKYHLKKGHYNANSTDVHQVRNIKNLSAYLIKYIAKAYQNEVSIVGKVWDCSNNLSGLKYYTTDLTDDHIERFETARAKKQCTFYTGDRFTIVQPTKGRILDILSIEETNKMQHHLQKLTIK